MKLSAIVAALLLSLGLVACGDDKPAEVSTPVEASVASEVVASEVVASEVVASDASVASEASAVASEASAVASEASAAK